MAATPAQKHSETPVDANPAHPFFGHGGSYRLDPATGKTVLLERAGDPARSQKPAVPLTTPAQE